MPIDLQTAMGRLLSSGTLRETFAADPERAADEMDILPRDRQIFVELAPEELEFQAGILLRKRFQAIQSLLPETVAALGADAWPLFGLYGRNHWPKNEPRSVQDAWDYCESLIPGHRFAVSAREENVLRFALGGRRLAVHPARAMVRGRSRPALQILFRNRPAEEREFLISFGL